MGTFEFDGEKYKKASRHQKEWGNKLISRLQLSGNESILDLGCGDGILTEQLSLLVPEGYVLGIDASVGMIEKAKQNVHDNLEFRHMDINEMDFDSDFDVIFSNAALHWVKDHNKLLKNTYTALEHSGIVVWNFAGDGNCKTFYEVMRKKIKDDRYKEYFADFEWPWFMPSKAEYEALTENMGFSEVTISEENADRYFANADEMIRWIDQPSLVPFMQCVPDEVKKEFRDEVVEEMLGRALQPDGTCFETFRRINVRLIK